MLAGASGVDLGLLVVAADDSVMPQTREHLEILRLLGLRNGVIALTKTDLVDEVTREVAELEIRELVKDTFLEDAPIISTSAQTGAGVPELKAAIADACRCIEDRGEEEWFRLAIDRAFIVQGHGTIVTGSVSSGTLRVGDELEWQPRGERVRVRSLQNHDQPVEEVRRGQRAAVNLAGVRHEEVVRGQEVATPGYLVPSRVLTVRLHCLADRKRPIKHRLPVRVHLGTSEIMGTIALLDCDAIPPGKWGLAQLFFEEPATATWGQPFVTRESSAAHTLGGGQVLQPVARKIRRRHVEVLERIERLWSGDAGTRRDGRLVQWIHRLAPADLVRGAGVGPAAAAPLILQMKEGGVLAELVAGGAKRTLLHQDNIKELENRIMVVLSALHQQFPLMTLHDRRKVEAQLDYIGDDALVHAAVERLLAGKQVIGDLRRIARADFKPKLNANQRRLKDKIVAAYQEARFQPPEPGSFACAAGGNAASLKDLFEVCLGEGFLVP